MSSSDKLLGSGLRIKGHSIRTLAPSLFPLLTATLAALIIYVLFTAGVERGMDHVVAFGPETEENAIAIAITELVFGVDGYVANLPVLDELMKLIRQGGDGPNDPRIIPNLSNADLINQAITNARSLKPPEQELFVSDGGLRTMIYNDLGLVDFTKIAFSLFGFKIQSLYYLFFAIISLSTITFLVQFWRNPVAQALLLCSLFAFYLELQTQTFNPGQPTFWAPRHGSTLVILPMWHLVLLMAYRVRLSLVPLALALVQVVIVVLAIKMRGSAAWSVLFLAALAALFAFRAWRQFPSSERSIRTFARLAAKWPFVLVLLGLLANSMYTNGKLNPAYFTDDITPYHGLWHSGFYGIYLSPTLIAQTGFTPEQWDDAALYGVALAYLRKHHVLRSEAEYISPWTKTVKSRLHDNVMRSVFLSWAKEHPLSMLELYLYWKPRELVLVTGRVLLDVPIVFWLITLLATSAFAVATVAMYRGSIAGIQEVLLLALAALAFSGIPNIWAFPSPHRGADVILSLFIFLTFSFWSLGVWLLVRGRAAEADALR